MNNSFKIKMWRQLRIGMFITGSLLTYFFIKTRTSKNNVRKMTALFPDIAPRFRPWLLSFALTVM